MSFLQTLGQKIAEEANPSNFNTPILGPIRQGFQETFGTPPWLDPSLSQNERSLALVMSMGTKGGGVRGVKDIAGKKWSSEMRRLAQQHVKNQEYVNDLRMKRLFPEIDVAKLRKNPINFKKEGTKWTRED